MIRVYFFGQKRIQSQLLLSDYFRFIERNVGLEVIATLFSQASVESIILFIIAIGFAIRVVLELWDYFYSKLKKYFNYTSERDKKYDEILESLAKLQKDLSDMRQEGQSNQQEMKTLQDNFAVVNERLQENTRNMIIDKHHYFCYEIGAIDDLSLQSLERRYLYYKSAGGNSFIDGLMEELRALPRLGLKNQQSFGTIYKRGEK